jgi:hypothetical protein
MVPDRGAGWPGSDSKVGAIPLKWRHFLLQKNATHTHASSIYTVHRQRESRFLITSSLQLLSLPLKCKSLVESNVQARQVGWGWSRRQFDSCDLTLNSPAVGSGRSDLEWMIGEIQTRPTLRQAIATRALPAQHSRRTEHSCREEHNFNFISEDLCTRLVNNRT